MYYAVPLNKPSWCPRRLGSKSGFLNSSEFFAGRWQKDESCTPHWLAMAWSPLLFSPQALPDTEWSALCRYGQTSPCLSSSSCFPHKRPWPLFECKWIWDYLSRNSGFQYLACSCWRKEGGRFLRWIFLGLAHFSSCGRDMTGRETLGSSLSLESRADACLAQVWGP